MEVICRICDRQFNSNKGLAYHIKVAHKVDSKEYYDRFLKSENEGLCLTCGKETSYQNITVGYSRFCSQVCSSKSEITKEKSF